MYLPFGKAPENFSGLSNLQDYNQKIAASYLANTGTIEQFVDVTLRLMKSRQWSTATVLLDSRGTSVFYSYGAKVFAGDWAGYDIAVISFESKNEFSIVQALRDASSRSRGK